VARLEAAFRGDVRNSYRIGRPTEMGRMWRWAASASPTRSDARSASFSARVGR